MLSVASLTACQALTSRAPRVALKVQSSGVTAFGQSLGYTL